MQAQAFARPVRCYLLAAGLLALAASLPSRAVAQQTDTIPSIAYFGAVELLYEGDYRDAERVFRRELRGAIKTVDSRWIDSICYHAMLGEVYYHQGRNAEALAQFNYACGMFLQYPKWMLRVQFTTDPRISTSLTRRPLPWGTRGRQFALCQLPTSMLIGLGTLDNREAASRGGVIRQAQYWKVDVVEVVRATTLAIRRRNELLGPLGAHDSTSRNLVLALSRGGAPPNHWSGAWIDLQLGLAQVGVGETKQAMQWLNRSLLLAGKFDHALTCVALLEQGRLQMESGNMQAAASALAEASYLAFFYEDYGIIDDAFRWGTINRLVGAPGGVNPELEPAAIWARRKRLSHVFARISMAIAEELMSAGNWNDAQKALVAGQSRLRDARAGLLGNWSLYLDARLQFQAGRDSARATLARAVQNQIRTSYRNLQIGLTNDLFDSQQLSARKAVGIYQQLLADPTAADMVFRPLESLAVMKTVHQAAFDRWLIGLLSKKDTVTALEVTDLAKRRRFRQALAWGGRLAALRDVLEGDKAATTPQAQQQRSDLLLRFPAYDQLQKQGRQLASQLRAEWWPDPENQAQQQTARVWKQWSHNLAEREAMLRSIGLTRVAVDASFPPRISIKELKRRLQPGQALLVFHNTQSDLYGFLFTAKAHTQWSLGPANRLAGLLSKFLRDLGNYDANRMLTPKELASTDYQTSGSKLYTALLKGSSIDPGAIRELIVVPDHLIWYVPLDALPVEDGDRTTSMISLTPVRYAPTIGLAMSGDAPARRVQRTGIAVGDMVPGNTDDEHEAFVESLRAVVAGPMDLQSQPPVPSALVGSLLDTLLVLREIETDSSQPLAWSPLQRGRGGQGMLGEWLTLPQFGPQCVLLPGMRTPAERGFKVSRRNQGVAEPGAEMFFASCGLMSTGARTVLLSRWRVGGQSTLDLMREFLQELPHAPAADAWQRSVQLAIESPIDPLAEMRVKPAKRDQPITAAHPFFWGGYLLIDTGAAPPRNEQPVEKPASNEP